MTTQSSIIPTQCKHAKLLQILRRQLIILVVTPLLLAVVYITLRIQPRRTQDEVFT